MPTLEISIMHRSLRLLVLISSVCLAMALPAAPAGGARPPLRVGCHKGDNDAQVPSVHQWTEHSARVGAGAVGVVFLLCCGHASLGQLGRPRRDLHPEPLGL